MNLLLRSHLSADWLDSVSPTDLKGVSIEESPAKKLIDRQADPAAKTILLLTININCWDLPKLWKLICLFNTISPPY